MAEKIFGKYTQKLEELTRNCNLVWQDIQSSSKVLSQQTKSTSYTESPEDIIYRLVPDFIEIFKKSLDTAIKSNREYGRHSTYKTRLENIFEDHTFAIVSEYLLTGRLSSAYRAFEMYAGDMSDFYDGVWFARQVLLDNAGREKMRSPKQRAVYWRRFVWGTDDWERTIKLRLSAWKDKAPYWIWLEYGNYTKDLAFPQFYGTNFFWNALQDIKIRYMNNLIKTTETEEEIDYSLLFETIANDVVIHFLRNPSFYQPGEVLQRFYYEAKKAFYEFRVTPKGRLGFRKSRTQ